MLYRMSERTRAREDHAVKPAAETVSACTIQSK
jgi:hypothetical protein